MADKIKILYIIPLAAGLESWGQHTRDLIEDVAGDRVELTMVDLPNAPVKTIMSLYHSDLVAPLCIEAAIQGERDGYDAIGVACLLEPGITAMKEVVQVPVVGDAEAAMHYASFVGRRFSFLTPGFRPGRRLGSDTASAIEDLARKYGFFSKLASVRSVAGKSLDFAGGKGELPRAMLEEARLAMNEDGADAVISYPTMEVLRYLQENLEIPVIDPVQAFAMMAESLVRLRASHSKRAFPKPYDLSPGEKTPVS